MRISSVMPMPVRFASDPRPKTPKEIVLNALTDLAKKKNFDCHRFIRFNQSDKQLKVALESAKKLLEADMTIIAEGKAALEVVQEILKGFYENSYFSLMTNHFVWQTLKIVLVANPEVDRVNYQYIWPEPVQDPK